MLIQEWPFRRLVLAAALATLLAGCVGGSSGTVGTRSGDINWWTSSEDPVPGIDSGQVTIATLMQGAPEGVAVAFWSDLWKSSSGNGHGEAKLSYYQGAHEADGRRVEFRSETRDGQSVTVTIAGRSYDRKNGSLFLISALGGTTQVQQLTVDLASFPREDEGVRKLAASNPDIAGFFRGAKEKAPAK
ncbi:hypothetical protein ACFL59_02150 [Planctomycetota bacterium]